MTVEPTTSIWTALALMRSHDIRHLLVVDDAGALAGVLSNRDYRVVLDRANAQGVVQGIRDITVHEIMTRAPKVLTADAESPLSSLGELMILKNVGAVPIVDAQQRPIGIVTQKDVLRELLRFHRAEPGSPPLP